MSSTVIHYFTIRVFSISPNFRRTMGVQKHLFEIERNVIKELLKLKNQLLFIPKIIFYCKLR